MARHWLERIFGVIGESALEASYRAEMERLSMIEAARARVMTASPYNGPISTFMRGLPKDKKARARFRWDAGEWQMPDREKIRVVNLYKQAGWPGMSL